jgi:hypothetical protein
MLTIILAIGSLPQAAGTCSRNIPWISGANAHGKSSVRVPLTSGAYMISARVRSGWVAANNALRAAPSPSP